MKKEAYIINYFSGKTKEEIEAIENPIHENDYICIYLSKKDYDDKNWTSRFVYGNAKHSTYIMLDRFFMKLRELQKLDYELIFKCEQIKDGDK